ncbi:MAG: S41 family peptidase [Candidatus Midichloria sp.]|uniref:S41 family peptidase n=1 Tax=Hyalomma marginatum TaxID=34627 RepID=A0A8S4C3F5_9ACAR|nr:S41 family peptidase [Hyalomma marginatum]CAG7591180.1 S41 family peptidase [Hyalomma marginatum]
MRYLNKLMNLLKFLSFILLFCISGALASNITSSSPENRGFKLFNAVFNIVKLEYVEYLSDAKIFEYAAQGLLSLLDPHSAYLSPKSYQEMKSSTKGEFGGLGMELTMENGIIKVISPYEDSPAYKAGIRAGDYITMIDGKLVKGMNLGEASEKLRGEPGTKISLKIYRDSAGVIDVNLEREIIKITPVRSKTIAAGTVGYIKISMFNDKASSTVKKDWLTMIKNNPNLLGLVLDLRSNPGGILAQAKEVADLFLVGGDIVTVGSRNSEYNQVLKANGEDITKGLPIAVIINSGSASAAEIVAGALQDNKRALVVGVKSFGKGSVQKVIPLFNGAAVKITTSLYYTPSGTSIQAHGIVPDIVVPEATIKPLDKKGIAVSESSLIGHISKKQNTSSVLINSDNNNEPILSSLFDSEESNDFQLLRAADVVKSMSLYKKTIVENNNAKKIK